MIGLVTEREKSFMPFVLVIVEETASLVYRTNLTNYNTVLRKYKLPFRYATEVILKSSKYQEESRYRI